MLHNCKALIIHCIDFRFGKAIKQYLEGHNLLDDVDIVSVAGAAKNIASPQSASDADFLIRQIQLSKGLHNINQVVLMNHTDCGAYGGRKAFPSEQAEHEKHLSDLRDAEHIILKKFPSLEVKKVLAKISPAGINFEELN